MLGLVQMNLEPSKSVSSNLVVFHKKEDIDVALMQESDIVEGMTIKGLRDK